ncbi:variable surface protein Vir24 [Plasmodium vivax Brazil I]|uniref:Variable surface protein Vir24 n=1 Tax=Plasmodium vivax (strain Brazil I) TaxID=1033975 RepID=A0A0J9STC5_PLAV1|nr:variable surface protein Vir24 [Plasmodium vivax Brazil I]
MADDGTLDPPLLKILKDPWDDTELYQFYKSLTQNIDNDYNSCKCDSLKHCNDKDKNNICSVCKILKKILDKWDTFETYEGTTSGMPCEYLNHWIYGRLSNSKAHPNDIDLFYEEWKSHYNSKEDRKYRCLHKSYNKHSREELGNRKKVFDFSKYYSSIENILNGNGEKREICKYIKDILKLYYIMTNEQNCKKYKLYENELNSFNKSIKEKLNNLKTKCPGDYIEIVLNKENEKTNLSLSYEPEIFLQKYDNSSQYFMRYNTNEILSGKLENLQKTDLEELEAYKVYKEFNSNDNLDEYCSSCDSIFKLEFEYPGITNLCKKLGRNLKNIKNEALEKHYEKCGYLYYWIYDQIWKRFGKKLEKNENIFVVDKLIDVWYKFIYELKLYECFNNPLEKNDIYMLKEKKILHDYFKNYDGISKCKNTETQKCTHYCVYVNNIIKIYKKYITDCCIYFHNSEHYWDKCDNFFKCDKKYNLFDLLSEFNCIPEENREDINNAYENAVIDKKIKLLAEKIPEKSVTGTKQEVSELPKIVEQTNIFDELLNDPFNLSALGGYSLIGIFLTFFVFYKVMDASVL